MAIQLDPLIIPTRDRVASARLLGHLLGVPWAATIRRPADRDEGVPGIPLVLAIAYPDRATLEAHEHTLRPLTLSQRFGHQARGQSPTHAPSARLSVLHGTEVQAIQALI